MKNKWLIGLLTGALAAVMCFGIAACGNNDAEVAKEAIETIKVLYLNEKSETPSDYTVLGQARVDENLYSVEWTATAKTADVTIGDYVTIGKMDESTKLVTIGITRATVDVEYTLKATVTVGEATESVEFDRKIPKKTSEKAITASLDFSSSANRTKLDSDNNEQVWKQNGVTLTNSGNVADYTNPIRLYKNTTVSIEMENARIIHIDFHSAQGYDDSPYPEYLKTSLEASDLPIKGDVTVSDDGLTISVDFESALDVVTFKTTAGQCRLTSIDVEANERSADEHVHKWTYEHVAGTWTHKATCTAAGCDVKTKTEDCTPKLNVCECGYTYTAKEIVDALFALEKDKSLPGTYTLTGVITKVTEVDTGTYKNCTFEMTVEGQTVTVYRAKGTYYADVKVGGTATVNGELLDYNGTKEFTQGASVVAFTPATDTRTDDQKVKDAKAAFDLTKKTYNETGDFDLPAEYEGTTLTWAVKSGSEYAEIANGKLNVKNLPEADAEVVLTVTIKAGNVSDTKDITVTIKAEGAVTEGFTPITAPAAGSDFYLAMDINGTWYYSTGVKEGNYLGTTTEISKAAKVTVAASGSGWTLVTNGKYIEFETSAPNTQGKTYVNIMLKDAQTEGKVWMWNAQYSVFTMDEGGTTYFMGTYGTFTTFNSANISYIENDNEYIGKIGTYTGSVEPTPGPGGETEEATASISFADRSTRTEYSDEQQIWQQNGITLTNLKGESSSNVGDYAPLRLYKSSSVKIEYTSAMTKIVFHCATYQDNDYPGTLQQSLATVGGITVTVDGTDVTVTFSSASNSLEFVASAQIRLNSIDVYAGSGSGQPSHVHNYTYTHTQGTWTHTGTCSVEGCDQPTITEDCTPELNVCKKCTYTYTQDEILEKLFALDDKAEMPGTYQLTGVVKADATAGNSGDWKFDMTVGERTVQAYYVKHEGLTNLPKAGDTVTVTGPLKRYGNTYEFNGGNLIKVEAGSVEPEPEIPEGTLTLTSESLTMLAPDETSGYDKYKGTHTVGTYQVTVQDVMVNTNYGGYSVLQFKKETGLMTLKGSFVKITLTIVSTYEYSEGSPLVITAGETVLTARLVKSEDTGKMNGNYVVMMYTVEYTVEGEGEQTFTLQAPTLGAVYLTSIAFSDTAIDPEPAPAPEGDLSLTSEALFAGVEGSGYAAHNGEHTVNGYAVTTNQVMANNYTSAAYKVLQFQANSGTLTVEGNFSKITIIVVSTRSFQDTYLPEVKAGETVLEAKLANTASPEGVTVKSGDTEYAVYLYTVEYTVTSTGVQTITIAKTTGGALYMTSIEFTAAADAPAAILPGKKN